VAAFFLSRINIRAVQIILLGEFVFGMLRDIWSLLTKSIEYMNALKISLALIVLFVLKTGFAQPVNDNCADPISINVGLTCESGAYSNIDATTEPISPAPSCGFYQGGDVWFTFVVPASGAFRIETTALSAGSASYQLYTGTCGDFISLSCSGGNTTYNHPALASQTLYLRVFRFNSAAGLDFTLCIWEPLIPANDFCSNAIALPVTNECNPQNFSCIYTTNDGVGTAPNPTCGFFDGGDVWFIFTVPASGAFRIETTALSAGSASYQLYTGTCGDFAAIRCAGGNTTFNHPELASQTLYLRVFRFNSAAGLDFTLCIWEPLIPTNDFCSNAIALPVTNECNPQNFSCIYTTNDGVGTAPNPTCGFFDGGDVWFTFVVPNSGSFRIETEALSAGTASYQLYSGSCGSFAVVSCAGGNSNFNLPLFAGETLYLRVYRFASLAGLDFSICIKEFESLSNDNCAGATTLNVGSSCVMQTFNSFYQTTESGIAPSPACVGYTSGDVWFKFIMPASGKIRVERNNISGINAQFALYTGTCGGFTNLACAQLTNSLNVNQPALGGQEIYMRVYNYGSDQGGEFEICVWEPPTPDNDMCADAIHLPVGLYCQMQMFSNAYCTTEPGIAPNPTCVGYVGGDIWFTFTMPESGQIRIERNNLIDVNAQWAVYEGTCGAMTNVACAQLVNQLNINQPSLAGETLYLRVYNYGSVQGGTFEICIHETAIPVNDMCANAIALPLNQSCEMGQYTNANCTAETGVNPSSDCLGYVGGDVWFTVEVPASGRMRFEINSVFEVNAQMALYEGDCDGFTEVACAQLIDLMIVQDSSLAGETLYLRVFNYGSAQGGVFDLCVAEADCNGDADGAAYFDGCGTCVGGNTELDPCEQDCNGVFGGTAYLDNCDECVGGNTGELPCSTDCNGDFGGIAFTDNCGTCVGGETGLLPCVQDCDGVFGGTAYLDNCSVCVGGDTGLEPCIVDCNGDFGGTAFLDNCDVCVGGDTGLEPCLADCNGDFGGSAYLDNCFICVGGNTGLEPCLADCNGDFGGTAYVDDCDVCVGGNTGLEPCANEIPLTQLQIQYCEGTYDFVQAVMCYSVPGAQNYRWELTSLISGNSYEYTRGYANRNLRIGWVQGISLGETYEVRVKVQINGEWGNYGPMCTINTGELTPPTQLTSTYSPFNPATGQAFVLCNNLLADYIYQAQSYEWELTGPNTLVAQSPSYFIQLGSIPGIQMNATYQVRVRVLVDGQWGVFGVQLPIQIGLPSNTQLIAVNCGSTRQLNQAVAAINVCGAQSYTFRFQHPSEPERILVRTPYTCPLWQMQPPLTPGETYSVSVKVAQGGVDGDYSTACDVTIAGPQAAGLAGDLLVSKLITESTLGIYPNPNSGSEVRIELNGIEEGAHEVAINIYDIYGKLITRESFGHQGVQLSHIVHFEQKLAVGMYLIHVSIDGEIFESGKIVVQ
jgi:hypothetical protein